MMKNSPPDDYFVFFAEFAEALSIVVHDSTPVCAHVALSGCVVIAHPCIIVEYHQQHAMSRYPVYRFLVVKSLLVLFFCVFNRNITQYDSELGVS